MAKTLPFSNEQLTQIASKYPTPFHLYDEGAILENAKALKKAFSWCPDFKEYFAVKATPNPYIMKILKQEGFGADCSSLPELIQIGRAHVLTPVTFRNPVCRLPPEKKTTATSPNSANIGYLAFPP